MMRASGMNHIACNVMRGEESDGPVNASRMPWTEKAKPCIPARPAR